MASLGSHATCIMHQEDLLPHLADALTQRCAGQGSVLRLSAPLAALRLACKPGAASQNHVAAVASVTVTVVLTTVATMTIPAAKRSL